MAQADPILSTTVSTGAILISGKRLVTYLIGRTRATDDEDDNVVIPIEHKEHVAIVFEVTRAIAIDVVNYLGRNEIDANLIVIKPKSVEGDNFPFLDASDQELWTELVRDFARACTEIQKQVGQVNYHIFLSAPMPLVFGVGAVWGTVREAMVYHFVGNDYVPSLPLNRTLRY